MIVDVGESSFSGVVFTIKQLSESILTRYNENPMDSIQSATSSGVQLKQAGTALQPVTSSHSPPPKYWQPVSVLTSDRLLSKPAGTVDVSSAGDICRAEIL